MQPLLKAIRGRQSPEEWRACGCLILCALAFSLMTVCVKHLGGALPVAEIVFVRSLISIAITLAMLRRVQVSPWGQQRSLLLVRGLLGTTALLFFFEALARLPLAAATLLQYTYPTLTAISAWLLLGEPIRRRIGLAVLLGWLGVMLVVQPDWIGSSVAGLPAMAVVIGLGGALLTALAYVSVRQLSAHEHPLVIVFYFPFVSVPATLPFFWGSRFGQRPCSGSGCWAWVCSPSWVRSGSRKAWPPCRQPALPQSTMCRWCSLPCGECCSLPNPSQPRWWLGPPACWERP